jgi:hypothetical protein
MPQPHLDLTHPVVLTVAATAVCLTVAVAVVVLWLLRRRRRAPPVLAPAEGPAPPASERRAADRWRGRRGGVDVSTAEGTFAGRVGNVSPGGLGLHLPCETPTGSLLRVRAAGITGGAPWLEVRVRHCKRVGPGQWVVGCEFLHTPSWNVLRLFG